MKKSRIIFLFLLFLFFTFNANARDYSFPSLEVKVEVEKDGSVYIEEKRTAVFDGNYSGLFQWINKQPEEEITDIKIREGNKYYDLNPSQEIGPAGTYFIKDEGDKIYIDWSFEAENENRTFILSYRIKNAVKIHNDIAELYYIFSGDEWDKPISYFRGELSFSEDPKNEIKAWGHGPLNGTVSIKENNTVIWEINNIPSRTFVAGRVAFPLEVVPEATRFTSVQGLDQIISEETELANKANRERNYTLYSIILGIFAFISSIVFSVFQWFKYGREFKGEFDGDYYRELPSLRPPVEAGYLYRFKRIDPVDITATILDLGRRGFLVIEEYIPEKKGFFQFKDKADYRLNKKGTKNISELKKHEKIIYDFLFNDAGDGDSVSFQEIEKYSKDNKKDFVEFWNKWKEEVTKIMDKEDLFEKTEASEILKRTIPGMAFFIIPVILFILFKGSAVFAGIGLFSGGFIYLISLASHSRRTEKGATEFNKWKAFKKFIKDFSNIEKETIPSLVMWEHYLVYAVSLGAAKEVLKALELSYPDLREGDYTFGQGWYIYNHSLYSGNSFNASVNNMTNTITTSLASTVASATGQHSSGGGSGGGFSGGGGMGASGGGGGGAR